MMVFYNVTSLVVYVCFLFSVVHFTECRTYHISFLGRNYSMSTIGSIVSSGVSPPSFNVTSNPINCFNTDTEYPDTGTTMMNISMNASCSSIVPNGTAISDTGLIVEADESYQLHVYQTDSDGKVGDGFLAIPDEYLGTTYYVITYCSTGGVCQFAVTAVQNNTALNVMFPKNVTATTTCIDGLPIPEAAPHGSNVPVMLQEFQVLHVESLEDLSGTYIVADNDVSLIVGSRDVPDHTHNVGGEEFVHGVANMIEQVPPVNRWGTEFVAAPNYYNIAGDLIKIVSKEDNTVVHIQGLSPFKMTTRGDVVEKRIEWELHSRILTSHPVLIMQIMSVDLYNDSSNVYGAPSMVLVPHVNQWTDVMEYYCQGFTPDDPIITMVAESTTCYSIPIQPTPSVYLADNAWSEVPVTKYSVIRFIAEANETKIGGAKRAAYAHCNERAAVLIAADWSYENQECQETASSPGDGIDNDCDGEIDEDICQSDFIHVIEQNDTGSVPYKTFNIHGINSLHFTVQTCQIAMVKLQSSVEPADYFTLHISATGFDDLGSSIHLYNVTNCSVSHDYVLEWHEGNGVMVHILTVDELGYFTWNDTNHIGQDYDTLVVTSMLGRAEFQINLYETDCKFITDYPDNFGSHFLVPIKSTDISFIIYIVTGIYGCTVEFSVGYGPLVLLGNVTKTVTNVDLLNTGYLNGITVTGVKCEIAVYLEREIVADNAIYTRILPADILSPTYMLYGTDAINRNISSSTTGCEIWPIFEGYVVSSEYFNGTYGDVGYIGDLDADNLNMQHKWEADHVTAVFCGNFPLTMVQMPPLSALGTQFYIPKLSLSLLSIKAVIYIILTEDSTVITVKGDYDQITAINHTGDIFIRPVVADTIYDIQSTKPIQVQLEIRALPNEDSWNSVIMIPPTTQYKTDHVFPGLSLSYLIASSTAVDASGYSVTSLVTVGAQPTIISTSKQLNYPEPTFSLTFAELGLKHIVIASDTYYNVINEVCNVTKGTPGDMIDNDCDGLPDEESCSAIINPGYIDIDIDGSIDEDCAANTTASVETTLYIPNDIPQCVNYTIEPEEAIGLTVGGTNISYTVYVVPTTPTPDPQPTFAPMESPGESVIIVTNPPPTGTTLVPVVPCETDCICPCGWVNEPQNYTIQEIEEVVRQIQEKLKISKEHLSSTIRKKTSAPDDRTSAQAVGFVGLGFMIVFLSSIVLLDVSTLIREIKTLCITVRDYCRGR